ncbi:hypothetical protein OAH93_02425 [Flavobacteriales bacterium]|nr:hypothetical protein [Flavobacteriales bacterium]
MEFPLYQTLVYGVDSCFQGNLELECRLVSLFFFYASLFIGWRLIPRILHGLDGGTLLLTGSAVLASSYYLYWADAILIESLCLFLALSASLVFSSILNGGACVSKWLLLIVLSSLLALTKVTAYVGVFVPIYAVLFLSHIMQGNGATRVNLDLIVGTLCLIGINYFLLDWWVVSCDLIKLENPLASVWASENLTKWNFGTIEQRLSGKNWVHYFKGLGHFNVFFWSVSAIVGIANSFMSPKLLSINLKLLCISFFGPLVFFNLYKVHTYYDIANNWALLMFYVVNFVFLTREFKSNRAWQMFIQIVAVGMFVFFAGYRRFYYTGYEAKFCDRHLNKWSDLEEISGLAKPGVLVSFLEPALNSVYAYHLDRKIIMFSSEVDNSLVSTVMDRNTQENVVGVILHPDEFDNWDILDSLTSSNGWLSEVNYGGYRLYH